MQLLLISLLALAAVASAEDKTECSDDTNIFMHNVYTHLAAETSVMYSADEFSDPAKTLRLWNGREGTAGDHMNWLLDHVIAHTRPGAPGFRPYGSKAEVTYEIHDEHTAEAGGAGYFRLTADLDVSPALFTALMMDAQTLHEMDETVRVMDFSPAAYPDGQTWLVYWRASPGFPFWDIDGLDLTGYRKDDDGTIFQISVSAPEEIPHAKTATRAVDRYWGYRLTPLDGGKRTRMTLLCQTTMDNVIPHFAANWMIGDVLSDYTRTAEKKALELSVLAAQSLMAKFGLR